MKKFYLLLLLFAATLTGLNAQCTVNTNNTVPGITPPDSLFPPVIRGTPYDTVAQVYVPDTFSVMGLTINVIWMVVDTVTNVPTDIAYARNPVNDTIYGGGRACFRISGTTSDTVGTYVLDFQGWIRIQTAIFGPNDTTFALSELATLAAGSGMANPFGHNIQVVNASGIYDMNHTLESAMQVMPNPNNGQFEFRLNYNGELSGDLNVIDGTGRVVYTLPMNSRGLYTQTIDLSSLAKGIYAVQLRTDEGVASKLVSVE